MNNGIISKLVTGAALIIISFLMGRMTIGEELSDTKERVVALETSNVFFRNTLVRIENKLDKLIAE